MAGRKRFRVGDVFTIPIDDERVGLGQIVDDDQDSDAHFHIAVFDELHRHDEALDVDAAVKREIAFLALSMDALLYNDMWKVVGHCEVDMENLSWPAYKEAVDTDKWELVDHSGKRRRAATAEEAERFPFRPIVDPKVLELALQARHGIGDVHEDDEELRPPPPELSEATAFDDG
jgi:hypothetical protein